MESWTVASPGSHGARWAERWLEATRWWADALGEGPRTWPSANQRLLVEVAEGLTRAFRGRSIEVQLGGRNVRALLDRLWLDPRADLRAFRLELRDVECDGWKLERVMIDAETVVLTPPPDVSISVTDINVEARTMVEPLVTWLDRRSPDWRLHIDDRLRLVAARRRGRMQFTLDALVIENELQLELRGIRYGRLSLRLPKWLRLSRRMPVPALPAGIRVLEARRRRCGRVDLQLAVPTFRQGLDLARLRDAVSRGDATPLVRAP